MLPLELRTFVTAIELGFILSFYKRGFFVVGREAFGAEE